MNYYGTDAEAKALTSQGVRDHVTKMAGIE
jgi:hypothetical protein